MMEPKVFISYSWTDQQHQESIKYWADRLIADGVEVVLDVYDFKEGDDKHAFMETMVTDTSVTHVLVICDRKYAEKANARNAGVGTESQIISGEVYEKVKQSKFIPIVCEFDDNGEPILPVFMKSRKWIDFSGLEKANENWEQLIRVLYDKPLHVKPEKGKAPIFITSDVSAPTNEALAKFNSLKQALLQDKKGINHYRRDFIESCINFADKLRVRERPAVDVLGEKIVDDCRKLKVIRNHLCDWVLLEGEITDTETLSEVIINVLEKLREIKSRPPEVNHWCDSWFEAHTIFVYETFLYFIAALLKTGAYQIIHDIFSSYYLMPSSDNYGQPSFERFDCFFGYSDSLQEVLAPKGKTLYAPAAELLKRQADREDLPFSEVMQAELLAILMTFVIPDTSWYPQTLYYYSHNNAFPFFLRAAQHKYFDKLAVITGISSADELREKFEEGYQRVGAKHWNITFFRKSIWSIMNMDNLGTLK